MTMLSVNNKNLLKMTLVWLIVINVIYFMISKTWDNYNIYVPISMYVPMLHHAPVMQYVAPMATLNTNRLLTNNHQEHLISPQIRVNKSHLSKGSTQLYSMIFRSQNVYFPGDALPEKQVDAIRMLSDTKLKRRFTYKQYDVLKKMMEEIVQLFVKDNIRYSMMNCNFHKLFKCYLI